MEQQPDGVEVAAVDGKTASSDQVTEFDAAVSAMTDRELIVELLKIGQVLINGIAALRDDLSAHDRVTSKMDGVLFSMMNGVAVPMSPALIELLSCCGVVVRPSSSIVKPGEPGYAELKMQLDGVR